MGSNGSVRMRTAGDGESFPKEISCICCRITILSREHMMLLAAFVAAWGLLIWELSGWLPGKGGGQDRQRPSDTVLPPTAAPEQAPAAKSLPEDLSSSAVTSAVVRLLAASGGNQGASSILFPLQLIIVLVCITTMLYRFEDLDLIQQMERDIKSMEIQVEHVGNQRSRMKAFWQDAQELTELWLYRTVPRLDLFKEIHSQLEDCDKDHMISNLNGANQYLEDLSTNIGALQDWKHGGEYSEESKKKFAGEVNRCCQEGEFDGLMEKLKAVTENGTKALKASAHTMHNTPTFS